MSTYLGLAFEYPLLTIILISLGLWFVYFLFKMIDICCEKVLGDDGVLEAGLASITAALNSYYGTNAFSGSFVDVRNVDLELPFSRSNYGCPLPTAPEEPPPFHEAVASYRSGHGTSCNSQQGSLQATRGDDERDASSSRTIHSSIEISEGPPPSYDEVVGKLC